MRAHQRVAGKLRLPLPPAKVAIRVQEGEAAVGLAVYWKILRLGLQAQTPTALKPLKGLRILAETVAGSPGSDNVNQRLVV
jgi:hypothetical protein